MRWPATGGSFGSTRATDGTGVSSSEFDQLEKHAVRVAKNDEPGLQRQMIERLRQREELDSLRAQVFVHAVDFLHPQRDADGTELVQPRGNSHQLRLVPLD